jgi:hypothetical protein
MLENQVRCFDARVRDRSGVGQHLTLSQIVRATARVYDSVGVRVE